MICQTGCYHLDDLLLYTMVPGMLQRSCVEGLLGDAVQVGQVLGRRQVWGE